MPAVKFEKILSYTSEDPNHPAENLLKSDSYLKWKCLNGDTNSQQSVTIQLAELYKILSIDIGNECSALVEVHVARADTDFQTLLAASSLMSPIESRNGENTNRVRMFGSEKLAQSLLSQKWDRIKVVCSQPFNKKIQFGLSFLRLYCVSDEVPIAPKEIKMGSFTLKEESSDEETPRLSLFGLKKNKAEADSSIPAPTTTSKASANAPDVGFYQLKKDKKDVKIPDRKRPAETDSNGSSSKKPKLSDNNKKARKEKEMKHELKKEKTDKPKPDPGEKKNVEKFKPSTTRPFKKLMKDVVFVMSGYENPQRAELRDKLVKMGAKYERDWNGSCTHLICAFSGTPKYKAVKGKGKIVTAKWIEDCHNKKIRFPWRRYNLEKHSKGTESEEEIWADELVKKEEKPTTSQVKDTGEDSNRNTPGDSDEQDTDDEIQRVLKKKTPRKEVEEEKNRDNDNDHTEAKGPTKTNEDRITVKMELSPETEIKMEESTDIYDEDTDIDEENQRKDTRNLDLPHLPDFFHGLTFFMHQDMKPSRSESIQRYIIAYGGKISEYMSKDVSFVITDSKWTDDFDEALGDHPKLQFVKSSWIKQCCDEMKLVPKETSLLIKT